MIYLSTKLIAQLLRHSPVRFLLSKKAKQQLLAVHAETIKSKEHEQDLKLQVSGLEAKLKQATDQIEDMQAMADMNQRIVESQEIMMNMAQKNLDKKKADVEKIKKSIDGVRILLKNLNDTFQEIVGIAQNLKTSSKTLTDSVAALRDRAKHNTLTIEESSSDLTKLDHEIGELDSFKAFLEETIHQLKDVADQLLVIQMNGRIESAHAGAFGEGFTIIMNATSEIYQQVTMLVEQEAEQVHAKLSSLATLYEHSAVVKEKLKTNVDSMANDAEVYEGLEVISKDLAQYAEVFMTAMGLFASQITMITNELDVISQTIANFTSKMADDLNYDSRE